MGGSNIAAKEEGRCCEWLGVQLQRNGYVPANVTYEFLRRSSSAAGLREVIVDAATMFQQYNFLLL
jgi:hypothetical protein